MDVSQVLSTFPIARLPSWAGTRQNVSGSTIDGTLVPPINARLARNNATLNVIPTQDNVVMLVAELINRLKMLERAVYGM
ncbi:IX [Bovine adenovirus 10]|uniref:IX n=1 Tax=Bovine adenovirus C serotype 10 TaxID=39788 RepID=A0A9X9PH23_ADEBA|nr:IX [Bovine adenovirus 10]